MTGPKEQALSVYSLREDIGERPLTSMPSAVGHIGEEKDWSSVANTLGVF